MWEPLFASDERVEHAFALVGRIATSEPGLATGGAGVAIARGYLQNLNADEDEDLPLLLEKLVDALPPTASLSHGLGGVGFALAHLDVLDDEGGRSFDDTIASACRDELPAELSLGLGGLAVYAFERRSPELLDMIARRLVSASDSQSAGACWRSAPDPRWASPEKIERHPEGWYDLGLAHGIPGVIAVLAYMPDDRSRALAIEGLEWLWRQRTNDGRFPRMAGDSEAAGVRWCYGHLGIATALVPACDALDAPAWKQRLLELAVEATRAPVEPRTIGLCHGAAGNAHMFNRLFQATREPAFRDAAVRWFDKTFEMLAAQPDPLSRPGFLEGHAGVALALCAAISDIEPAWDRALLMSSLQPAR